VIIRKRLVRLHLEADQPTVEGVLTGMWANHYVLKLGRVFESPEASHSLEGPSVRVPRERVVLVQELHT
jgi:hypothetical protein